MKKLLSLGLAAAMALSLTLAAQPAQAYSKLFSAVLQRLPPLICIMGRSETNGHRISNEYGRIRRNIS